MKRGREGEGAVDIVRNDRALTHELSLAGPPFVALPPAVAVIPEKEPKVSPHHHHFPGSFVCLRASNQNVRRVLDALTLKLLVMSGLAAFLFKTRLSTSCHAMHHV